jgi:hypothetical protein
MLLVRDRPFRDRRPGAAVLQDELPACIPRRCAALDDRCDRGRCTERRRISNRNPAVRYFRLQRIIETSVQLSAPRLLAPRMARLGYVRSRRWTIAFNCPADEMLYSGKAPVLTLLLLKGVGEPFVIVRHPQ